MHGVVPFFFIMLLPLQILSFNPESIRHELPLLVDYVSPSGKAVASYLKTYGLDTLGTLPVIGTFRSDSFTCVGQVYRPDSPRGTVYFIHGYFDHTGTLANGIGACLKEHYTVAVFDLPGHGLSSGERGAIGEFSEYVRAFRKFMQCCSSFVDTPYVFIGHSTGCAVGLEYLLHDSQQPFQKIIFLAPLVRMSLYHVSIVGNAVLKPFLKTTPRWFRNASHDREFLRRFRRDILQPTVFPLRWASAYYRWFDSIRTIPERPLPLVVIQGTGDNVVDWKYNLRWFETHVDNVSIVKIPHARHQLLNESAQYREECIVVIRGKLREARE